jgi:hypothetical protein
MSVQTSVSAIWRGVLSGVFFEKLWKSLQSREVRHILSSYRCEDGCSREFDFSVSQVG